MTENYWRDCALWMADVIAATAHRQLSLSGVGHGEKVRQANIAALTIKALEGHGQPSPRKIDTVIRHLSTVQAPTPKPPKGKPNE